MYRSSMAKFCRKRVLITYGGLQRNPLAARRSTVPLATYIEWQSGQLSTTHTYLYATKDLLLRVLLHECGISASLNNDRSN